MAWYLMWFDLVLRVFLSVAVHLVASKRWHKLISGTWQLWHCENNDRWKSPDKLYRSHKANYKWSNDGYCGIYNHLQGGQVYGSATTTRGSFPWRRVTVSALIGWTSKFLPVRCWMKTLSVRESDDNVRVRYKSNSSPLSGQRQPPCLSGQALLQHSVAQQGGGEMSSRGSRSQLWLTAG